MSDAGRCHADAAVLACGAWLKNTACLLRGGTVVWSAPHGDLDQPEACAALRASLEDLLARAGGRVEAVAHDLHPDFYSTRLASEIAAGLGVAAIGVQHHHAHIAAVLAEHREDGPAVGLALDGYGLGADGTAWGGELLLVGAHGWQRLGQLWPLALPGGDTAAREPWRMAAAALQALDRGDEIAARFAHGVGVTPARIVRQMLERQLNCPQTSSAGRWFDAAAGVLGLSVRQSNEAEAAMALESCARRWCELHGEVRAGRDGLACWSDDGGGTLDLRPLMQRLLEIADTNALGDDAARGAGAALFHAVLGDALADGAARAAQRHGTTLLCLGGGCFANDLLGGRVERRAAAHGLRVLRPRRHSCGDAGLALGQAWVAAHALSARCVTPVTELQACA